LVDRALETALRADDGEVAQGALDRDDRDRTEHRRLAGREEAPVQDRARAACGAKVGRDGDVHRVRAAPSSQGGNMPRAATALASDRCATGP